MEDFKTLELILAPATPHNGLRTARQREPHDLERIGPSLSQTKKKGPRYIFEGSWHQGYLAGQAELHAGPILPVRLL